MNNIPATAKSMNKKVIIKSPVSVNAVYRSVSATDIASLSAAKAALTAIREDFGCESDAVNAQSSAAW